MIGFDKRRLANGLLLSLPLTEGTGAITADIAKNHYAMTVTGLTWSALANDYPYLTFPGTDDFLELSAADSAVFNFTSGDFTLAAWLYNTGAASNEFMMCQGATDVDGWSWFLFSTNITLRTNQAAAHTDIAAVNGFTNSAWQLAGVTRSGASGQFYRDGEPIATTLNGGLTDPVSCAAGNKLLMGIDDNETSYDWTGYMAYPRIWNRAISSYEWSLMFASERHLFGV